MLRSILLLLVLLLPAAALAQNQPPVADAGPDQEILLPATTVLDGAATDPEGDSIVSWLWVVESAPPASSPTIQSPDERDPLFFTDTVGEYVLSLSAFDGFDWSAPDFVTIRVRELVPPVANITVDVTTGPAPLIVQFDGSGSTVDSFGGPLAYDWNFGDGGASTEVAPMYSYGQPGTFTAVLRVVDDLGQQDLDTIDITVTSPAAYTQAASDSGRYSSTGFHNPTNTEYQAVVGNSRSFFVFDLTSVTDPRPIVSASLLLDTGVVSGGTFGGIDYTLYDVSTPIPTLVAGGDGLTAIYDDLGTGVAFSAATEIAPGTSLTEITIPLLPAGVAAVRAAKGGQLAIGGLPSGLSGNFAFDGTDVTGARLQIEFADAQVPMLSPLAGYVLAPGLLVGAGLIGIRRRRREWHRAVDA